MAPYPDELIAASRNPGKIAELRALLRAYLPGIRLLSAADAGFRGEILETGTTFEENALLKARTVFDALGGRAAVLGDDSGLLVDALGGEPGVRSARYAGEPRDDEANNALLLRRLEGVPEGGRTARFACCLACLLPGGGIATARGTCRGLILREPRGRGGFGYDPYFLCPEAGRTFAEMGEEEKNRLSHRGRAARALAAALGNPPADGGREGRA